MKSGDDGEKVTPVPIPNTAVKLFSADGTWGAAPWESRSSPVSFNIYRESENIYSASRQNFLF